MQNTSAKAACEQPPKQKTSAPQKNSKNLSPFSLCTMALLTFFKIFFVNYLRLKHDSQKTINLIDLRIENTYNLNFKSQL
jgi:hypothetical protein